jgi:hypothetical protein
MGAAFMKIQQRNDLPVFMAVAIISSLSVTVFTLGDQASDSKPWDGPEARIEKHRMADAGVVVVDADGRPAGGIEIKIKQTQHAFLFGSNVYGWGRQADEKTEAAYRTRFAELLNYATLPF